MSKFTNEFKLLVAKRYIVEVSRFQYRFQDSSILRAIRLSFTSTKK